MNLLIVFLILISPSVTQATYQQDPWRGTADIKAGDDLDRAHDRLLENIQPYQAKGFSSNRSKTGIKVGQCSVDLEVRRGQDQGIFFHCETDIKK
jgi:hypothetical protein